MKKYLIIGLGNIGPDYHETRHNIGFMVLDKIAHDRNLSFETKRYGDICEYRLKGRTVYLLKPNTYMNLSGKAVDYWVKELKIPIENIMVITDDLALPSGKIRLKGKGSSGGHNGLQNIQDTLLTSVYPRLRFGIGNEFAKGQQVNFVLNRFDIQEIDTINVSIERSIEALESFVLTGLPTTMNRFN